jgi:leucyl aminopeptidase
VQEYFTTRREDARPLYLIGATDLAAWSAERPAAQRWIEQNGWRATPGTVLALPGDDGALTAALVGVGEPANRLRDLAAAASSLPPGAYRLAGPEPEHAELCALGWAIGQYRFERYRAGDETVPKRLLWPEGVDRARVQDAVAADRLLRDLVNTPASDLGPEELEAAARELATGHGAECDVVVGDELLARNFPAIHAVGRASSRAPRLIDLRWGDADRPRVTLVGKGVCFDTGGLDIKPASAMRLMKKDMGGAAHVLGLARMIMGARLPVALRVLIPAVENSISGNAYRPGDVVATRKGLSVEIGNTDAEGRMVLCDALALADEESPELLIDLATLTGAARVALGPELPALYCDDDELAERLQRLGTELQDPMWRMPLWSPYDEGLKSPVADLNHIASGGFAGSIYAALYLRRFVSAAQAWVHLDVFSWNPSARSGRPEGAESQSVRALFALIAERFGAG